MQSESQRIWNALKGKKTRSTSGMAWALYSIATVFVVVTGLNHNSFEGIEIVVLGVIYATLAGVGDLFSRAKKKRIQKNRNDLASALYADLKAGNVFPEYFVYLRALVVDKSSIANPDKKQIILMPSSLLAEDEKYEEWFADLFTELGPVICLGYLHESLGAGTLETDEDCWLDTICELMKHSKTIFIVPGQQDGILDEIWAIRANQWLDKTVFMQPLLTRREQKEFKLYWNETRDKIAADLGMTIPEFSKKGLLFTFNDDGSLKGVANLPKVGIDVSDFVDSLRLIGIKNV